MIGKALEWGTFPKCGARLGYCFILGPFFLRMAPPYGFALQEMWVHVTDQDILHAA